MPLDWAATQNNLGNALRTLGERETGTARLEQAVAAYSAALEEQTRDRVPLDWAMTQNNLGNALRTLGERESRHRAARAGRGGIQRGARGDGPATACRSTGPRHRTIWATRCGRSESARPAPSGSSRPWRHTTRRSEERTRDRVPLDWATTQNNLGNALRTLGERETGTERLEQAVAAYTRRSEERTRDRVPLDWATTQNNLGNALKPLGAREAGTARLEEAVAAWDASLTVTASVWPEEWVRDTRRRRDEAQSEIARRLST